MNRDTMGWLIYVYIFLHMKNNEGTLTGFIGCIAAALTYKLAENSLILDVSERYGWCENS